MSKQTINGCEYEFVKNVPSETKVKGWIVKVNGDHYVILAAPIPRLYTEVCAFTCNRAGRADDLNKPLFKFRGDDLQIGVDVLTNMIANNK